MILKKEEMSKDLDKYRPISLTSCVNWEAVKIYRIYEFLEIKKFLGFRNNKGGLDNLSFFTQKPSENLNRWK